MSDNPQDKDGFKDKLIATKEAWARAWPPHYR